MIEVITSWQVILVTIVLVIYMSIVNRVTKRVRVNKRRGPRVKVAPPPTPDPASDGELELEEEEEHYIEESDDDMVE